MKAVKRMGIILIALALCCLYACQEGSAYWKSYNYQFGKTNPNNVLSIQMLEYCGEDGSVPNDENSIQVQDKYFNCIEELDSSYYEEFLLDLSKYFVYGDKKKGDKVASPIQYEYGLRILYTDGSCSYWSWGVKLETYENVYGKQYQQYTYAAEWMEISASGKITERRRTNYYDYHYLVFCNYFTTKIMDGNDLEERNDAFNNS
jgi:hypothetical protein